MLRNYTYIRYGKLTDIQHDHYDESNMFNSLLVQELFEKKMFVISLDIEYPRA